MDFEEKLKLLKIIRLSRKPITEADLSALLYGENTAKTRRKVLAHLKELQGSQLRDFDNSGMFGLVRQKQQGSKAYEWLAHYLEPRADREQQIEQELAYTTLRSHLGKLFPPSTSKMILEHIDNTPLHYCELYAACSTLDHPSTRPRLRNESTNGEIFFLKMTPKPDPAAAGSNISMEKTNYGD